MTGQNEPTQIPNGGENVFAWSRQDIQDAFEHLDTSDAQAQALKYATAASEWDQGLETFKRSVGASISEAWEGASAEAAKKAITEYTTDAANLTDLLSGIGKDISAAANAVVQTKNGIKPAARHSWTTNIPYFGRAQAASEEHTRTQNEADTREAMLQHYVTEFRKTDSSVPVLPPSLNPIKQDTNNGPNVSSAGPNASTTNSGPTNTNSNDTNTKDSTDPSNQSNDQNQSTNPSSDTSSSPTSKDSSDKNDSTSTTPSATDSTATTPSSVSPSSYTSSGTGGSGGDTSGGGVGRSVPGTSTPNANQAVAAAASTRTSTSTSGLGGMGGMGGGAGRGKGEQDEDRTHTTPDYLINAENAEELIGDLPRTLPGGVIGGDFDDRDSKPPAR
ncbi:WXG100 family type VII secretion target [Nocardia vaccinii]|uniref:WXG100 family type VII secretion target n=1 Tax=Nocardia vaccinii TaxID=1822 RepID=UPI000835FABF|nr:WXG100 family type VII secretion target [Nocardia vaccinii]